MPQTKSEKPVKHKNFVFGVVVGIGLEHQPAGRWHSAAQTQVVHGGVRGGAGQVFDLRKRRQDGGR